MQVPILLVRVSPHNKFLSKKGSRLEMHSVEDHKWGRVVSLAFPTIQYSIYDCIWCLVWGNSPWLSLQVFQHFWLLVTALSISHWLSRSEHFCSPTGKVGKVEEAATNRHGCMVLIPLGLKTSSADFMSCMYNTMCTQIIVVQIKQWTGVYSYSMSITKFEILNKKRFSH